VWLEISLYEVAMGRGVAAGRVELDGCASTGWAAVDQAWDKKMI
jgi:hypothetical protein